MTISIYSWRCCGSLIDVCMHISMNNINHETLSQQRNGHFLCRGRARCSTQNLCRVRETVIFSVAAERTGTNAPPPRASWPHHVKDPLILVYIWTETKGGGLYFRFAQSRLRIRERPKYTETRGPFLLVWITQRMKQKNSNDRLASWFSFLNHKAYPSSECSGSTLT
jgi:hypothetical protein